MDRISCQNISPKEFLINYILKRKPCILTDIPTDLSPLFPSTQSPLEQMMNLPGFLETLVMVEQKSKSLKQFGVNDLPKMKISMRQLIQLLMSGRNDLYLTTQYEKGENHKHFPEPIPKLLSILPVRPELFQHLIPQQLTLWMGQSVEGQSSGLHHDFHDNCYIVLQGRKRFVIFHPKDVYYLYTNGKVDRIHENLMIEYQVESADEDDDMDVEMEEEVLCESMNESDSEEIDWNKKDDFQDSDSESETTKEAAVDEEQKPPSFSQIPVSALYQYLSEKGHSGFIHPSKNNQHWKQQYPLLEQVKPNIVELNAGEILYLPASWFHEVTSFSENIKSYSKNGFRVLEPRSLHLALNYWFHPPTRLFNDGQSLYNDEYLEKEFQEAIQSLHL